MLISLMDTVISQLGCWSCPINQFWNRKLLFENCLRTWIFPDQWKKQTLFQFTKRVISNSLKITAQFPCFQFAKKYLSVSVLILYLNTSKKTIFFLCANQILSWEIPVSNHSHKKQIVWKHGPNWPLYALMLRTKLY